MSISNGTKRIADYGDENEAALRKQRQNSTQLATDELYNFLVYGRRITRALRGVRTLNGYFR